MRYVQISKGHLGGERKLIEQVRDDLMKTGKWAVQEDATVMNFVLMEKGGESNGRETNTNTPEDSREDRKDERTITTGTQSESVRVVKPGDK